VLRLALAPRALSLYLLGDILERAQKGKKSESKEEQESENRGKRILALLLNHGVRILSPFSRLSVRFARQRCVGG
jgi:hypothetical protein